MQEDVPTVLHLTSLCGSDNPKEEFFPLQAVCLQGFFFKPAGS
jgi:hypothetical protein